MEEQKPKPSLKKRSKNYDKSNGKIVKKRVKINVNIEKLPSLRDEEIRKKVEIEKKDKSKKKKKKKSKKPKKKKLPEDQLTLRKDIVQNLGEFK